MLCIKCGKKCGLNKKILFIVNVDWFFVSHRLPLAVKAIDKGYEVHLACGVTDKKEYLESLGIIVHRISLARSNMKPLTEIKTCFEIYKTIKTISPGIINFITIKPVLYGGIVSRFINVPKKVFSISGLGFIFITNGIKAKLIRLIVKLMYKLSIVGTNSYIIVQNPDDRAMIETIGKLNITIIKGSGADLNKYKYIKENNTNIKISMACRLLRDKGVFEFVEAAKILKEKFPNIEFNLYGDIDIHNPASLTSDDVEKIKNEKIIKVHGFTNDIATVFSDTNIVVLPSYREGLPKVLVEAAACGRAVVTTDVPGCRDAITPNVTGLLCKVKDPKSLADAIEKLIKDDKLRNRMGIEGRKLAEKEFDINMIVKKHFEVYETR